MRNAIGLLIVVAIYYVSFPALFQIADTLDLIGPARFSVPLVFCAAYGAIGFFLFTGKTELRAALVFLAPLIYGIAMEFIQPGPGHAWGKLVIAFPLAALSAVATGLTGIIVKRFAPPKQSEP